MSARNAREVARAFGAILRAARAAAGISQEVLAERADCDPTYPSLLERGLRAPSLPVVIEIAQALGVEPAQLVTKTLEQLRQGHP